ncbi:Exosortase EpsH-related protein [Ferroglobus placidus DSM 10642]|uniref:Exosortase EpsH-related protein n=1 Tax=Ferroglobus placidus (strain DSM 10642 / AEDII12DO) TaxID=589924 RepID=D3RZZ7_FERPA|nr:archaeosortase C [Ferroglobus placidus]ADC66060.1 Exosortase EpsH-related protein [Ferroglobus placidus DSM 10642]
MDNKMKFSSELGIIVLAALIVGASIELAYGTVYIGIFFLFLSLIALVLLAKNSKDTFEELRRSWFFISVGVAVTVLDLFVNNIIDSKIQTFDTMVILFGVSLIFYGSGSKYSEIGKFGAYFSLIFLILFAFLFMIPAKISMYLPYLYGHYAVAVPVVMLLQSIGIGVKLSDFRIIEVLGENHAFLRIDLACFGWYSLLLVTSMVLSYNLTFHWRDWRGVAKTLIVLAVAVYIANLLRVAVLVYLTYNFGSDFMLKVHSHLGWIFFMIVLLPISYILLKR